PGAGSARHLRDIHLAPVIGVWYGDLFEDGFALGRQGARRKNETGGEEQPSDTALSFRHSVFPSPFGFKYSIFGSKTSRSSWRSRADGGSTETSRSRRVRGQPTPACT